MDMRTRFAAHDAKEARAEVPALADRTDRPIWFR